MRFSLQTLLLSIVVIWTSLATFGPWGLMFAAVLFAALARGRTRYRVPGDSEHLRTNLWLAERFGARARRDGSMVEIEGLGLRP